MLSDYDCSVCYQTYNAGLRCPRELRCGHTFCETCLRVLTGPLLAGQGCLTAGRTIDCPLCRHPTFFSEDGDVKAELKVDEGILEQLSAAGLLNSEEPEEDREISQTPAGKRGPSPERRNRKLQRFLRIVWWAIIGKTSQREDDCISNEELKGLAMMPFYL